MPTLRPGHHVYEDAFTFGGHVRNGASTLTNGDTGLLGHRFVGPPASFDHPEEVVYAALARGVTGILPQDTENGLSVGLQTSGIARLEVDAAYAVGARLTCEDDTGKGTVLGTGNPALVEVLEASAADGDVVSVRIIQLPSSPEGT